MRFSFGAQPLLEHRLHLERGKRAAFEAGLSQLDSAQSAVARLRGEFAGISLQSGPRDCFALSELDAAIAQQSARIATQLEHLEKLRTDLLQAQRDRRVLELLKERRLREFRDRERRVEDSSLI